MMGGGPIPSDHHQKILRNGGKFTIRACRLDEGSGRGDGGRGTRGGGESEKIKSKGTY